MHIFGKVLVWLMVIVAPVAMGFAAKTIQVRNSWLKIVAEPESNGPNGGPKWTSEQNRKMLEDKRYEKRALLNKLSNELLGWDQYWDRINANIGNSGFDISATLPANAVSDGQVVYGFQLNNDGPAFVGPFRYNVNNSTLTPTWTVDPDDAAQWQQNGIWRFRSMIPVSNKERFTRLDVLGTRLEERRVAKEGNLAIQDELVQKATDNLNLRMMELVNGNPNLEDKRDSLPPELIDGYVAALEVARKNRDAVAAEVDRLRRELKKQHDLYESLRKDNLELVRKNSNDSDTNAGDESKTTQANAQTN